MKESPMATPAGKRKRRLGKGLGSLLSTPVEVNPPEDSVKNIGVDVEQGVAQSPPQIQSEESPDNTPEEGLVYIQLEQIVPNPRQPRQVFDDEGLSALADSIKTAGLMQPVVVRNSADENRYELVAGERRWRAAELAGLATIPALIRSLDDRTSAEWALIENLQREDLNPIDRAEAFDRLVVDFSVTQNEIATQLGIDRSSVANFLRLNDLEPFSKDAVRDGRLTMGHAKVLLGIPESTASTAIAKRCATEQWSVRELERQLKKRKRDGQKMATDADPKEMFMQNLAEQLGDHLGTQVSISLGKKKGSGKLTLSFYSNEQFEGLLDMINFSPKS